jgi:hypothetical protein
MAKEYRVRNGTTPGGREYHAGKTTNGPSSISVFEKNTEFRKNKDGSKMKVSTPRKDSKPQNIQIKGITKGPTKPVKGAKKK